MNERVSHLRTKKGVVKEFRCQTICQAAMRVVARKGFARATVQEIADEAGVAKGTVYLYFNSRQEILDNTMEGAVEELLTRLRTAAEQGGDFSSVLERIVSAQLTYFDEHRDFFRLYVVMAEPAGERRLRKHATYRTHIAQLVSMIAAAARRHEIRAADHERLAIAVAAVTRDVVLQRMTEKTPPPLDEDVRFVRDFICRGMQS
jgi:AcrR family transcriptional regulator